MFYGDFRKESVIRIIDINAETFKLMLEFIYTDQISKSSTVNVQLSIDTIIELYYCAEKYLLTDLRAKCLWEIYTMLNYQNILSALDFTLSANIQPILEICLKRLRSISLTNEKQFHSLAQQEDYHMSKECLQYILDNYHILGSPSIRNRIIEMIKVWCQTEAHERQEFLYANNKVRDAGMELKLDSLEKIVMNELSIPVKIIESGGNEQSSNCTLNHINNGASSDLDLFNRLNQIEWQISYRNPYKSTSILKIYAGDSYHLDLKFNRIVALKSIIINSRLMPDIYGHCFLGSNYHTMHSRIVNSYQYQQRTISNNIPYTYNECISIKLSRNAEILHEEEFHVKNVEYNSKVFLTFRQPVILCRDLTTKITFHWMPNKLQNIYNNFVEYPTKHYSNCEKMTNGLCIKFNANDDDGDDSNNNVWNNKLLNSYDLEDRCIVEGIEYTVLS